MARPKINEQTKSDRLLRAKGLCRKLNVELPQYVYAFPTPSGRIYIRYEPPNRPKTIIRSEFPSADFYKEYAALLDGGTYVKKETATPSFTLPPAAQTWRWLCEQYFESSDFLAFGKRDQRVRRNILTWTWAQHLLEPNGAKFGDMPAARFQTEAILTLRDRKARYASTPDAMYPDDRRKDRRVAEFPEAANSVVRSVRSVTRWANEHLPKVTGGVSWGHEVRLLHTSSTGHPTWGEEQCKKFEQTHERGTKARFIYELALGTAQRRADLVRLGPKMIGFSGNRTERLKFVQDKNRSKSPVTAFVPITQRIRAALVDARANGLLGEDTWIITERGTPYSPESLTNLFREYCDDAGLARYSLHGLRKTAVVNMITADFTFFQIMCITGHRSKKEIERYGRDYMRELAMEAAYEKWVRTHQHEEEFSATLLDVA